MLQFKNHGNYHIGVMFIFMLSIRHLRHETFNSQRATNWKSLETKTDLEEKNSGLPFARLPKTQLQLNGYVNLCLQCVNWQL